MAEIVLDRIEFEATLDDMVDANIRLANRTKTFRHSRKRAVWLARVLPAAAFMGSSSQRTTNLGAAQWTMVIAAIVAAGVLSGYVFERFYDWIFRKRYRQMVAEQLGGGQSIRGEIELRTSEVWVRQHGNQMTFPWTQSAGIEDTGDAIELRFNPGLVVARNKYFATPEDRQRFLERARALAIR